MSTGGGMCVLSASHSICSNGSYESLALPKRVLTKKGQRNIKHLSIPRKSLKFIKDLVNTLIEASWCKTVYIFLIAYFTSWTFYACLYYLTAWAHGDLFFDPVTGERLNEDQEKCFEGADSFTGAFLLSMESQVSTGYGEHYPTEQCSEAIFLLIAQLVTGVLLDGCLIGIFYAKLVRPPKKPIVGKFSNNGVVYLRDGKLCLVFRVVDTFQHHGIRTKVKAFIFEERQTLEGEILGPTQKRLNLVNNGKLFLIWPEEIVHVIDKNSPLYNYSAKAFLEKRFEICLSIFGDSRKTGQTVQGRTSYLSTEIVWGQRFIGLISYNHDRHEYVADYTLFNRTEMVNSPLCSAKELDQVNEEFRSFSVPQGLNTRKTSEPFNKELNEADEEDEDEIDEEDDEMPGYSDETNMDTVEDMAVRGLTRSTRGFISKTKPITRTTSVVHSFKNSHDSVDYNNSFDHSKSLTNIERERENAFQMSRLRKSHRHGVRYNEKRDSAS